MTIDHDDIDEGDCLARQRDYWQQIRSAAGLAFGIYAPRHDDRAEVRIAEEYAGGKPFRYADRAGRVHECRSLGALAAVTRSERAWCDATWPEDR